MTVLEHSSRAKKEQPMIVIERARHMTGLRTRMEDVMTLLALTLHRGSGRVASKRTPLDCRSAPNSRSRRMLAAVLCALMLTAVAAPQAVAAPDLSAAMPLTQSVINRGDTAANYTLTLRNDAPSALPVGSVVTCNPKTWTGTPSPSFSYQWLRGGAAIAGATSSTYTTVGADAGKAIQCVVTGTNTTNTSTSAVAAAAPIVIDPQPATAPPAPTAPTAGSARPTITPGAASGTGVTLTCSAPSAWSGTPTYTYQWLRNGHAISGATGTTYVTQAADAGTVLQCQVSGTNTGGATLGISLNHRTTCTAGCTTLTAAITPTNSAANTPTITATTPDTTSGTVSVVFSLPHGVEYGLASGTGWTCDHATQTCTRSDGLIPQTTYPPISLEVWFDSDAPDTTTVSAGAIDSGSGATAHVDTSFTFGAANPFGFDSFLAGSLNPDGTDVTQAGAHPFTAMSYIAFTLRNLPRGGSTPVESPKRIAVDPPLGFIGNPQAAAARCPDSGLVAINQCPPGSIVGAASYVLNAAGEGVGLPSPTGTDGTPIYEMEPAHGELAEFAFGVGNSAVFVLRAKLRPGDYGLTLESPLTPSSPTINGVRINLCSYGANASYAAVGGWSVTSCKTADDPTANPVPFVTNPTECSGLPPVTGITMNSWSNPGKFVSATASSPLTTGCDQLPFAPSMPIAPTVTAPDAPTGLDVKMHFPQDGLLKPDGLATAHLKNAVVSLPEGMSINPGAANGLEACTDQQLGLKTDDPIGCPDASKIGTATATTPVLKESLSGTVYMRTQNSMDPESGEMFRIALVLKNDERGILVKLPGQVRADAKTGRLTATFDNNPQLPVGDLKLQFKGGSSAPLATPKACGPHTINAALTSWGGQSVDLPSTFTIGCTPGLGWFGPYFSAGTVNPTAGASAPFVLRVSKPDGQSDMNGIALSLPEGLIASLKGNVGRQIGTASVGAGPGPTPFWLSGPVVLEGPYGDAPFSLRVTVPVTAGPFNLGDVVVRQKIYVDSHDAHVTVVSDPLPTIVKGVPVRLQNLQVNIDKAGFMRNPTSCAVKSIGGTLGALTGQTSAVASRFQVGGCAGLPLRPRMAMQLQGADQIKRGKHPTLITALTQQPGEANLKSVKVRLPLSLALDPDNAEALCTPGQAAVRACPAASIVGSATAVSPVLNRPLYGDVFFVEGTRQSKEGRTVKTLPKLWVALRGEVAIDLWGESSIENGKYLVTTFPFVPDAPINAFRLRINGGQHGILAVTGDVGANLCQRRLITDASYTGQNGKQVQSKVHMDSPCGFKVRQKSVSISHAKVTVSGIGTGKLTISGKGIHKASRTIKHSKVATLKPRLTASGKRLYQGRKAIRLRVSFDPAAKGQETKRTTTVVKRAKKSSTRAHRTR